MKIIRASEIGAHLFCARSWWYQRQGVPSTNQAEMNTGSQQHQAHGRRLLGSSLLRTLGTLLLLTALALLVSFCTARFF